GLGRAYPVRRIERDPAEVVDMNLGPGMAGLLPGDAVGAMKVAADVAGGVTEAAGCGDEDMGEILAHAAAQCEGFDRGRACMGRIRVVDDLAVQALEQPVEYGERIVCPGAANVAGKIRDRAVQPRQRGLAQIEAGRKAFDRAADYAVGRLRLHFPVDGDG